MQRFVRVCPRHAVVLRGLVCPRGHSIADQDPEQRSWWCWDVATNRRYAVVVGSRVWWEEWAFDAMPHVAGRNAQGFIPSIGAEVERQLRERDERPRPKPVERPRLRSIRPPAGVTARALVMRRLRARLTAARLGQSVPPWATLCRMPNRPRVA